MKAELVLWVVASRFVQSAFISALLLKAFSGVKDEDEGAIRH